MLRCATFIGRFVVVVSFFGVYVCVCVCVCVCVRARARSRACVCLSLNAVSIDCVVSRTSGFISDLAAWVVDWCKEEEEREICLQGVICSEVSLCDWRNAKIQELTNQPLCYKHTYNVWRQGCVMVMLYCFSTFCFFQGEQQLDDLQDHHRQPVGQWKLWPHHQTPERCW